MKNLLYHFPLFLLIKTHRTTSHMPSKPKVLVLTQPLCELAQHIPEFHQFQQDFEVIVYETNDKQELITKLATDFNDVQAIWTTGTSMYQYGGAANLIPYFPKTVKVYVFAWVGYTEEEATLLKERNIVFCNVGDVSAHDVADHALILTLECFRFTTFLQKQFRESLSIMSCRKTLGSEHFDEDGNPTPPPLRKNLASGSSIGGKNIESPTGKIAGIVGLGSIGKEIAKRLTAIGMRIKYTKRTPLTEAEVKELGFNPEYYPTFDALIPEVDLIVNAAPHSPETTNLINDDSLNRAKKGLRIVNIGRGTFIDDDALFRALEDGRVTSIGVDVFRNEPHGIDPRFAKRWDVVMTPHVGNFTQDNTINSNIRCMDNIRDVLLGSGKGITPVL